MTLSIAVADAFTDRPFSGNPAAVCLLPAPRDDAWLQAVAREMNVAETAFLVRRDRGFDLRWFTPAVEVDLCGHATLASAHVLWEDRRLPPGETGRFFTRSGELTARREGAWIALDFPSTPPAAAEAPAGLADALGVQPRFVGRTSFDYFVEVEAEPAVRNATPDLRRLRTLPVRGVILTARASGGAHDFVSRFFAPGAGVDEDPVTGSAHCALGPFWAERLGKREVAGYQASSRGGTVRVRPRGDRVDLLGHAVTVWRGELLAE